MKLYETDFYEIDNLLLALFLKVFIACLETGFGAAFQEAWIQHDTIRENILCGQPFIQDKYDRIIHACALNEVTISIWLLLQYSKLLRIGFIYTAIW